MNTLIEKISQINANLVSQVELIDSIGAELGDVDSGEIAEKMKLIGQNISSVMDMLNNNTQSGGRRRTNKKHYKKRRTHKKHKMYGGYTYKSSRDLDRSSSIISASSSKKRRKRSTSTRSSSSRSLSKSSTSTNSF